MHAADAISAETALRMDNIALEGDRPVPRFRMAQERNAIQVFNQINRIDIELDGLAAKPFDQPGAKSFRP